MIIVSKSSGLSIVSALTFFYNFNEPYYCCFFSLQVMDDKWSLKGPENIYFFHSSHISTSARILKPLSWRISAEMQYFFPSYNCYLPQLNLKSNKFISRLGMHCSPQEAATERFKWWLEEYVWNILKFIYA